MERLATRIGSEVRVDNTAGESMAGELAGVDSTGVTIHMDGNANRWVFFPWSNITQIVPA